MAILVASLCFAIILCSATAEAINGGFTVELIPRNSPKSPFYNPLETPSQRVSNALRRSITRLARFRPNDNPSADITRAEAEYLIIITIGTPPVQIVGVADTGSDLIWAQCQPCERCFKQDAPLFDPSKSSTYANVSCGSDKCKAFYQTSCSSPSPESTCQYNIMYGDGSFTSGNLATDIVSLGSTSGQPIKFSGIVFGCGYNNNGNFDSRSSGIVGLGGGDASLISQIGQSTGGKFSYCLLPNFAGIKSSSKLNFGANAQVVGPGTVSTPMIQKSQKTFYYMTLEGISINGKKFEVSGSSGQGADQGNIIIDSGTTLTMLPPKFYDQIEPAVSAAIQLPRTEDLTKILSLCYKSSGKFKDAPEIIVHFTGADVKLDWYNTFIYVAKDVACFSFVPSPLDLSIYGNLAQMNFLVGYDITTRTLSFKPTDCTAN